MTEKTYYKSISINDKRFGSKLLKRFKSDGLAVITDVFTKRECKDLMERIVGDFVKLDTGIDPDNIEDTWTVHNLPPQTRHGLFQALVSNFSAVWNIRSDKNVRHIFETIYSGLREEEITDFIVSGDGINIRPGTIGPFAKKSSRDWPHLDQTTTDNIYKCVQGQAVLTDTTACFVASPKSHLSFKKILKKFDINNNSNWHKFTPEQIIQAKRIVERDGGSWQVPIMAPMGSFIIWASTTIHSARIQTESEVPTRKNPFNGWRGVVYVCYRPKEDFTSKQIIKRKKAFDDNRTTNHWGTNIFSKRPGSRFLYSEPRHRRIEKYLNDPIKVYEKIDKPELDDDQLALIS